MELIALKDYCISVRDGTHDTPKPQDEGEFLITSKHINQNTIDFESAYKISKTDYDKINKRSKVDLWDVLMTMIGTVGRLYVVREEPNFAIKNLALFKVGDEWRAKYLYYYLSSQPVQDYFDAVANGTSQHFVGLGYLRKFKIRNWNSSSMALVKTLDNYDKLIENNSKRINLLEDMIETLYKEWFVRFRFPGYEKAEYENGVPKCWEYRKFKELYSCVRGVSYSSDEIDCEVGVNLINLKNIDSFGGFRREGTKSYSGDYKDKQKVHYRDLIMGVTDMTQERRTVGWTALVPDLEGVISADLVKINSSIDSLFSQCLFRFGFYSKLFSQFGNGANVIHLKPDAIRNQKILLPKKEIIDLFVKTVKPFFDEIENLSKKNEILAKQRDSLLPRLMSGKLSVEGKEII